MAYHAASFFGVTIYKKSIKIKKVRKNEYK